eukprot:scaffold315736_cov19-Prasinocladus_malaysianus.AAC.2
MALAKRSGNQASTSRRRHDRMQGRRYKLSGCPPARPARHNQLTCIGLLTTSLACQCFTLAWRSLLFCCWPSPPPCCRRK